MKAKDLMKMLETVPADVEIVVGDLDCGMFWNPVISDRRTFTGWQVTEAWAEQQIRHVNFFALLPQAKGMSVESECNASSPVEVRALCL